MVPVVVLGNDITALGVVRCFARSKIPVYVVCGPDDLLHRSRFGNNLPGMVLSSKGLASQPDALADALERSGLERAVLCPCSDAFSDAVTKLPPTLDDRFPRSMPDAAAVRLLNDKGELAQLLERLNVAHPFTRLVKRPEELDGLMDRPDEQLFLKPRDSARFHRKFRVKAFRVASTADAKTKLAEIQKHDLEMMLQAYVPGPASNHYFIDGFRDANGVVRARFARQRLRIYPVDFGNSTAMVSVPLATMGMAPEELDRLLTATNYRGVFSAEFKLDPRDGSYRLLEVNTRPWWYIDFAVRSGVDVCTMMYRDALGQSVEDVKRYHIGSRCVYPYLDYHAVLALRAKGEHVGWLRWVWDLLGAMQPVLALDDPWPAIWASNRIISQRWSRLTATADRPANAVQKREVPAPEYDRWGVLALPPKHRETSRATGVVELHRRAAAPSRDG